MGLVGRRGGGDDFLEDTVLVAHPQPARCVALDENVLIVRVGILIGLLVAQDCVGDVKQFVGCRHAPCTRYTRSAPCGSRRTARPWCVHRHLRTRTARPVTSSCRGVHQPSRAYPHCHCCQGTDRPTRPGAWHFPRFARDPNQPQPGLRGPSSGRCWRSSPTDSIRTAKPHVRARHPRPDPRCDP